MGGGKRIFLGLLQFLLRWENDKMLVIIVCSVHVLSYYGLLHIHIT